MVILPRLPGPRARRNLAWLSAQAAWIAAGYRRAWTAEVPKIRPVAARWGEVELIARRFSVTALDDASSQRLLVAQQLEPVGLDHDGAFRPIDQLSYGAL